MPTPPKTKKPKDDEKEALRTAQKLGVWYLKRNAKRSLPGLVLISVLIVGFLKRAYLYSLVTTSFRAAKVSISSWLPTTLGANYLLTVLIATTAGVAFVPSVIRWANRPRLSLHGVFYATTKLRKNEEGKSRPGRGIYLVFVELWNSGRDAATEPVVGTQIFEEKVPKMAELMGNMETDISLLDSIVHQVTTAMYAETEDDDLANQFLKKGVTKVQYLTGPKQGKKMLFGFAFENGNKFYLPSKESIEPLILPIGDGKDRFAWFQSQARNSRPKVIAKNVKLTLARWNEVKLDYKSREEDVEFAREARSSLLEWKSRRRSPTAKSIERFELDRFFMRVLDLLKKIPHLIYSASSSHYVSSFDSSQFCGSVVS